MHPKPRNPAITTTWFNWPQQVHRGVWLGLHFEDSPRNNKPLWAQANPENFLMFSFACISKHKSQTHSLWHHLKKFWSNYLVQRPDTWGKGALPEGRLSEFRQTLNQKMTGKVFWCVRDCGGVCFFSSHPRPPVCPVLTQKKALFFLHSCVFINPALHVLSMCSSVFGRINHV